MYGAADTNGGITMKVLPQWILTALCGGLIVLSGCSSESDDTTTNTSDASDVTDTSDSVKV